MTKNGHFDMSLVAYKSKMEIERHHGCKRRLSLSSEQDTKRKKIRLADQQMASQIKDLTLDSVASGLHSDCLTVNDELELNGLTRTTEEPENDEVQRLCRGESTISFVHSEDDCLKKMNSLLPEEVFNEINAPCLAIIPYKPPTDFILSIVGGNQSHEETKSNSNIDMSMEMDEFGLSPSDWKCSDSDDELVLD